MILDGAENRCPRVRLFEASLHPPRCYVRRRRVHHGPVGLAGVIVFTWVAYTDRSDWRVWVRDFLTKS